MSWQEGMIRFVCGGLLVLIVSLIGKGKNPHVAGIAVLFPVVTVVAYYFLSQSLPAAALRNTVILSMLALPTVAAFLIACYCCIGRMAISWALLAGIGAWLITAVLIIQVSQRWL